MLNLNPPPHFLRWTISELVLYREPVHMLILQFLTKIRLKIFWKDKNLKKTQSGIRIHDLLIRIEPSNPLRYAVFPPEQLNILRILMSQMKKINTVELQYLEH